MLPIAHIRLSELAALIQGAMEDAFRHRNFWIVAEVSNHGYKESSHYHYFELVEKAGERGDILAKISAKAWGPGSAKIAGFEKLTGQRFGSNLRVLVSVTIVYHPRFGLQLELQDIDPNFTLGAMEAQRQASLQKLATEHPGIVDYIDGTYVTRNRRLPLPMVIQRLALVSAAQSAGAEDFRHSLSHNEYGYCFYVDEFHAPVQGEHHAEALLDCLVKVFTTGKPYDAVVIIRGGGAQTDFLIFDDYLIGLAIAKFPIPVITGIGHQKNETIADLMAHTALKTPTKAAEFIIAHNRSYEERMVATHKKIIIRSQQRLASEADRLNQCRSGILVLSRTILDTERDLLWQQRQSLLTDTQTLVHRSRQQLTGLSHLLIARPTVLLAGQNNMLQHLNLQVRKGAWQQVRQENSRMAHFRTLFRMLSPEQLLRKGFAMIRYKGRIMANASTIPVDDTIEVVQQDYTLVAQVTEKKPTDGKEFDL